jgi:hypothetical protein
MAGPVPARRSSVQSPPPPPQVRPRRRRALPLPSGFFNVHVHESSLPTPLLGLCAGFEDAEWRFDSFVDHLLDYLIEFTLTRDEWPQINAATAHRQLRRAARTIYMTDKYQKRGELGELLLHAVMRQHYGTEPMISKLYFKDSANDTVKGFDAAHVVFSDKQIELWLGEVKLYADIDRAISDVCVELKKHLASGFLRQEFMWIERKLPTSTPDIDRLRELLNEATSLDEVIEVLHVPVLLTYDSITVQSYTRTNDAYVSAFKAELTRHYATFVRRNLDTQVQVHLCLVPLKNKDLLVERFNAALSGLQGKR